MESIITKLTSPNANLFFGNDKFFLDSPTLEATLRYIAVKHHSGDLSTVELIKTRREIFPGYDFVETEVDRLTEDTSKTLVVITSRSREELPQLTKDNWVAFDAPPFPVALFLSKASETKVYFDKKRQNVLVFTRTITTKWVDLLCSTIPRLLPWIYTDDAEISEEELKLFKLFAKKNYDVNEFREIVDEPVKDFDFRTSTMKRTLLNWGEISVKQQVADLIKKSDAMRDTIKSAERDLAERYDRLGGILTNIQALIASLTGTDDSVYKYFASRKQLGLYKVSNDGQPRVCFSVTDTIEFYDAEEFKRIYDNPQSNLHRTKDIEDLFRGLYGENKGAMRVESVFELTSLSSLRVCQGVRTGQFTGTHLPHPHQYHYGCLGTNSSYIQAYMVAGDWDMAIDQAIASVKNLNFGDYIVLCKHIDDILANMDTCRCIVADNGKEMTPREFLSYIRANTDNMEANNG